MGARGQPAAVEGEGRWNVLRADALAGLTVAVMGVPQAMAYALIAGVAPVYGLYTAIVTCVVAAVLGSSKHLVTGPTNALCMVLLSLSADLGKLAGTSAFEIILLLTFMAGTLQVMFGLLRFGGVIRYVSNSVVIGFTAGAGILIAVNQVRNILGLEWAGVEAVRFHSVLLETLRRVPETNPRALTVGLFVAALVIVLPRLDRRIPGSLLAVIGAGVGSYLLGWHREDLSGRVSIVSDIEPISGSLPGFHIPELLSSPSLEVFSGFGMGALAIALLGLIEGGSIARTVATSSGQRLDFSRQFVGQGLGNMVGSMFSCFAGSGSFTRTAVCYEAGGRTRMAAAFSGLWTLLALVVLGPIANYLPQAALAGLLIVIAYSMIDKHRLMLTWRSGRNPRMVLVGTLASTLLLPLQYAIFVGIFLSIVVLLRATGKTLLTQLVRSDDGFDEVPFNRAPSSAVITVNMEGAVYFAAAEDLDYELLRCVDKRTRVVVLRMKRLRTVGSTAMAMLEHFHAILRQRGVHLVVCGVEGELESVLTTSGVRQLIGEQNIFYADNKLLQSTELALARAWSIVELERRMSPGTPRARVGGEGVRLRAADVMNPRCVRFGNQHQLREAVWLMSGLQKQTRSLAPEPLFLQDRAATLGGELSPWRLLEALTEGVQIDEMDPPDDRRLGELLRRNFQHCIGNIARIDLDPVGADTSIARLIETVVKQEVQVVPICDSEGRIEGLVSADDLLRGLEQTLRRREKETADG